MTAFSVFLFPHVETETSPLAMRPLLIAGMIVPVVDGDGGISIETVYDSSAGVLCAIPAYNPMQAGDKHDIYWGAQKIFNLEVQPDDINQPLFFFLPIDTIIQNPGWVEPVYYQLTRNGATVPEPRASELRLLVKLDRPAGADTEPHLPGHSHLEPVQLPEEVIRDGVDAERAKNGVPMTIPTYRGIALRDAIEVHWGTVRMKPHVVNLAQAEGREPIVIVADQATILASGDSAKLIVQYDVRDELWNFAVEMSKTTTVQVEAGETKLEAPIIKEADAGIIDLELLDKHDVTVYVRTRPADFSLGDTVMLTWTSVPRDGRPVYHTGSATVEDTDTILELPVPYEIVRAAAMGSASVFYALNKKDGSPPIRSRRAFASVIGDIWLLPEPTIREVLGDTLEPTTNIATVDVVYPGIANGDFINLIWLGQKANGQPHVHEAQHTVSANEAEAGSIEFYVGNEHISVLANGSLDLSYRVSNDDESSHGVSRSEHLLVRVEEIRGELPVPVVVEADPPDILDPTKVGDFVTVRVNYLGTAPGDHLTCDWLGAGPGGSWRDSVPMTTLTAGKPVSFRVRAEFVITNIGRYVKVRYVLWRAATKRYSYSQVLDLLIGELVGDLPPPDVLQAPDGNLNPMTALGGVDIKAGYDSMNPALDTVALRWSGTSGAGSSDDLELPGHDSGSVQFHLAATLVGANIGRSVLVDYDVMRYSTRTPSEPRSVNVLSFQDPDKELPRPQVPEAVADVLDLMEIPANATVTLDAWPFAAARQKAWLSLMGTALSGGTYVIELLKGQEISAAQATNGLRETLPRSELLKLAHSSPAEVVCKVAFDRSLTEADAIEFPRLPLTVRTRYDYLTPQITSARDSRGEVAEGEITFDDALTFKGTATRDQRVELFDAGAQSMGIADVNADWQWERRIVNLTERLYRITATALYDAVPVSSEPRTFTVNFAMQPIVDSVTDSKGPVDPGGITFDTRVTFTGRANPDRQVQIYDGGTAVPPVTPVDADGNWTQELTGLTIATHAIKVRGLYGPEPESTERTFIVARAETPIIKFVKDSKGDIAPNGVTFETSVTLEGTASPNQQVQLFNGATAIAPVTSVDARGDWNRVLTGLAIATYPIKFKALYGPEPESAVRTFEVALAVQPTIGSVKDSKGEVEDNGQTYDTRVALEGRASPNQQVQLYNGATAVPPVTQVNDSGDWNRDLTGLTIATHTLKVKALYSTEPESDPRTFTVERAQRPVISSVLDSKKKEVAHNGLTYDNAVDLIGYGSPDEQVEVFDGQASRGKADIGTDGQWEHRLTNLTVAVHNITAKALYNADPISSEVRTFHVIQAITPQITTVVDSKGAAVGNGGTTYQISVTLGGPASPNERIQLLDNNTPIGNPITVPGSGTWTHNLTNLTRKTYQLTAKALYGSEPVSGVRSFTVAAMIAPSISTITDSAGAQVAPNATTYQTTVTVTGGGTPGERITVLDGGASVRTVDVGANRVWSFVYSGLTAKYYNLTARAEYTVNPGTSGPWGFTVATHVAPQITSVRDSRGELLEGRTTTDRTVSLTGLVTPSHQVRIYDNNVAGPSATANSSRTWSVNLSVGLGRHSIIARAVTTGQSSGARSFTVESPIPPLNFNESTVTLAGKVYMAPEGVLPNFDGGTSVRHRATGGSPTYTYESSNTGVAVVDSDGLVTVRGKGSAYISVRDTASQSKRYLVNVTGAIQCLDLGAGTLSQITTRAANAGARVPSIAELREIYGVYAGRWRPGNAWYYWSNTFHSNFFGNRYYTKQMVGGGESPQHDNLGDARGMGLK